MPESEPKPRPLEAVTPGSGQGWKAVLKNGKQVVVHEIPVAPAAAAAAAPRLQRLAEHPHPSLSPILAWGTEANGVWVAVEQNEGTPLSAVLGRGRFTPHAAAALGTSVLSGVAALHEAGVAMGGFDASAVRLTANGEVRLAGHPVAAVRGAPSQSDLRADVRSCGMAICAAFGVDPSGAPAPPELAPGLVVTMRSMASGAMGPAVDRAQGALREMVGPLLAPDRQQAAQSEIALRAGGREMPPITAFVPAKEEEPAPRAASYEPQARAIDSYSSTPVYTPPVAPSAAPSPQPVETSPPPAAAAPPAAPAPAPVAAWEPYTPPSAPAAPAEPEPPAPTPPAAPEPPAAAPWAPYTSPAAPAFESRPPAPTPAPEPPPIAPAPAFTSSPPAFTSSPPAFSSTPPAMASSPPAPAPAPPAEPAPRAATSWETAAPAAPREQQAAASPPRPAPTPSSPTWTPVETGEWTPGPAVSKASSSEWTGEATPIPSPVPEELRSARSPAAATEAAPLTTPPIPRAAAPAPSRQPAAERRRPAFAIPERPSWLVPGAIAVVVLLLLGIGGYYVLSHAGLGTTQASTSPSPTTSPTHKASPTPTNQLHDVPVYAPTAAAPVTAVIIDPANSNCQLTGPCKLEVDINFSSVQRTNVSFVVEVFDRCAGTTTELAGTGFTPPGYNKVILDKSISIPSGLKSVAVVVVTQTPARAQSAALLLGADSC